MFVTVVNPYFYGVQRKNSRARENYSYFWMSDILCVCVCTASSKRFNSLCLKAYLNNLCSVNSSVT